jgi:hypothetical protein
MATVPKPYSATWSSAGKSIGRELCGAVATPPRQNGATGTPIDAALHNRLAANWAALRHALIETVNRDFDVFDEHDTSRPIGSPPTCCAIICRGRNILPAHLRRSPGTQAWFRSTRRNKCTPISVGCARHWCSASATAWLRPASLIVREFPWPRRAICCGCIGPICHLSSRLVFCRRQQCHHFRPHLGSAIVHIAIRRHDRFHVCFVRVRELRVTGRARKREPFAICR